MITIEKINDELKAALEEERNLKIALEKAHATRKNLAEKLLAMADAMKVDVLKACADIDRQGTALEGRISTIETRAGTAYLRNIAEQGKSNAEAVSSRAVADDVRSRIIDENLHVSRINADRFR